MRFFSFGPSTVRQGIDGVPRSRKTLHGLVASIFNVNNFVLVVSVRNLVLWGVWCAGISADTAGATVRSESFAADESLFCAKFRVL